MNSSIKGSMTELSAPGPDPHSTLFRCMVLEKSKSRYSGPSTSFLLFSALFFSSAASLPVPGTSDGLSIQVGRRAGDELLAPNAKHFQLIHPSLLHLSNSYDASLPYASPVQAAGNGVTATEAQTTGFDLDSFASPSSHHDGWSDTSQRRSRAITINLGTKRRSSIISAFFRRDESEDPKSDSDNPSSSSPDDSQHKFPLYLKIILILGCIVGGILLILFVLWLILYFTTRNTRNATPSSARKRHHPNSSDAPFLPSSSKKSPYFALPDERDFESDHHRPSTSGSGGGGYHGHYRDESLRYSVSQTHSHETYRDDQDQEVGVGKGKAKMRDPDFDPDPIPNRFSSQMGRDHDDFDLNYNYDSFKFSESEGESLMRGSGRSGGGAHAGSSSPGAGASASIGANAHSEGIPNPFMRSEEIELHAFDPHRS